MTNVKSNFVYSIFLFCLVIGALIGKQSGRNIEVMNAFELKFDIIQDDVIINQEYYATKEAQCKPINAHLEPE